MRGLFVLIGCVLVSWASPAFAAPSDEREDLRKQLAQEYEALSTSDCVVACRALASMQRAADRLCALDPGATCDDARAKVADATRRVRASCPSCAVEKKEPDAPPPPTPEVTVQGVPAAAPPSESRRGGCAGCATTPLSSDEAPAALGAIALGLLVLSRRRRERR